MTLITGSQHEVDSSELSFSIATKRVLKEAIPKCNPILLEPIARTVVVTPEESFGNVLSDLQSKRGEVEDTIIRNNYRHITAIVPRSNLFNYGSELRAISSGRAFFLSMEHLDFRPMPKYIQDQILTELNIITNA